MNHKSLGFSCGIRKSVTGYFEKYTHQKVIYFLLLSCRSHLSWHHIHNKWKDMHASSPETRKKEEMNMNGLADGFVKRLQMVLSKDMSSEHIYGFDNS